MMLPDALTGDSPGVTGGVVVSLSRTHSPSVVLTKE
jgi:hypothetical protein